ncbi:adenylate/guanylate cyclase domain-containing protein [Magnetococcales bacterium HHB-1]
MCRSNLEMEVVNRIKYSYTQLIDQLLAFESHKGWQDTMSVNRLVKALGHLYSFSAGKLNRLPSEKIQRIMAPVLSSVGAQSGRLYLLDHNQELICWCTDGIRLQEPIAFTQQGIVGLALTENQPIVVSAPEEDQRVVATVDIPTGDLVESLFALPLEDYSGQRGVLVLDNGPSEGYNKEAIELLTQAGLLALNFISHQTLQFRRAALEDAPLDIHQKEIHKWMDMSLRNILELATDIVHADRGCIYLYQPENKTLEITHVNGAYMDLKSIPSLWGIPGFVFGTGEAIRLWDAYDDPRFDPVVDYYNGYRTRNILCVPIYKSDGECLGVLEVVNRNKDHFSLTDEKRIKAMAVQIGLSIDNLHSFMQVQTLKMNNEEVLRTLTNSVIAVDMDGLITYLNPAASQLTGVTQQGRTPLPLKALFTDMNQWLLDEIQEVIDGGEEKSLRDVEYDVGKTEWLTLNVMIKPLRHADQRMNGVVLALEDISREKNIQRTMARYLDGELVKKLTDKDIIPQLTGRQTEDISVLFSDIRGFTSMTEYLGPEQTVTMLNEYFSYMEDVVTNHKGMVDKYIGDAIMALFGVPTRVGGDADNAVRCAIDMQIVLNMYNVRRQALQQTPLQMGVGVSSGTVITGNIGSSKRMSYTAIGDPVNLAARIESLTKLYNLDIMVCGHTLERCEQSYKSHCIDIIRVRGQHVPTKIYAINDHEGEHPELERAMEAYETAFEAYRVGHWDQAVKFFQRALEGEYAYGPAKTLLARCRNMMLSPMPNWDGIWTFHS